MLQFFKNLFQSDPTDKGEVTLIEEIAQRVVREGMASAAVVFLESSKPVSFLTGQAAIVATPLLGGFLGPGRIERYADLFSNRGFIERLIQRIEQLDAENAGETDSTTKTDDNAE
jgi:hypothetical protein